MKFPISFSLCAGAENFKWGEAQELSRQYKNLDTRCCFVWISTAYPSTESRALWVMDRFVATW
jgi:hypothetical protein